MGDALGVKTRFFESIEDALPNIPAISPSLLVLDLAMNNLQGNFDDLAGMQITEYMRKTYGDQFPILILTGREESDVICDCLKRGADDYCLKAEDMNALTSRIDAWLEMDYRDEQVKRKRHAAARALDRLVLQRRILTMSEWRNTAMLEITKFERGQTRQTVSSEISTH